MTVTFQHSTAMFSALLVMAFQSLSFIGLPDFVLKVMLNLLRSVHSYSIQHGTDYKIGCICLSVCPSVGTLTVAFLDRFSPKLAQM